MRLWPLRRPRRGGRISALSLLMLLLGAACGDIVDVSPDATSTVPDAAVIDADPAGVAKVIIYGPVEGQEAPLEGIPVVFLASDGSIIADVTTDASGEAEATVLPGAVVFVAYQVPAPMPLGSAIGKLGLIVTDVQPNDSIRLGMPAPSTLLAPMTVTFPNTVRQGEGTQYQLTNGCGQASIMEDGQATLSVDMNFNDICLGEPQMAKVGIAALDSSGKPTHFQYASAPFSSGGNLAVGGTFQLADTLDISFDQVPSHIGSLATRAVTIIDSVAFPHRMVQSDPDMSLGVTLAVPSFGDVRVLETTYRPTVAGLGTQLVSRGLATSDDGVVLEGDLLPFYGEGIYSDRTLAWSQTAGDPPDMQAVSFAFREENDGPFAALFIFVPPGLNQLALPELPGAYAEYLPVTPDLSAVGVTGFESSTVDGWAAARQAPTDASRTDLTKLGTGTMRRSMGPGVN